MATAYTQEWIQFFTGCGIPEDIAAMYALIFYENRIQKNMLLDLNKEYLRDMGITVMGDVIAILRHAKIIHEKYIRAQILAVDENTIIKQNNFVSESSPDVKKSTPMKRMLERYTRKHNSQESEQHNDVQVTISNYKVQVKEGEKIGVQKPMKKKIQMSTKEKDENEKGFEVPVSKARQALPENEGGYKIKMPTGTTERSKKLLELAKKRKSKTVFERLGEGSVSSTTSEVAMGASANNPPNKEKNPSVFSRLGDKQPVVSSTSSVEECEIGTTDQLQYAGIFKGSVQKKCSSSSTMRADEQEQSEVNKVSMGCSVKKRLGLSNSEEGAQLLSFIKKRRFIEEAEDAGPILKIPRSFSKLKPRIIANVNSESDKIDKAMAETNTKPKTLTLKQRIGAAFDASPFKKVRFGRTSHRLIPGTPDLECSDNYLKNYPKLTMTIDNTERIEENNKLSSGVVVGSLNSDNVPDKPGIKERIGCQGLLKKSPASAKKSSVKDRLG